MYKLKNYIHHQGNVMPKMAKTSIHCASLLVAVNINLRISIKCLKTGFIVILDFSNLLTWDLTRILLALL